MCENFAPLPPKPAGSWATSQSSSPTGLLQWSSAKKYRMRQASAERIYRLSLEQKNAELEQAIQVLCACLKLSALEEYLK